MKNWTPEQKAKRVFDKMVELGRAEKKYDRFATDRKAAQERLDSLNEDEFKARSNRLDQAQKAVEWTASAPCDDDAAYVELLNAKLAEVENATDDEETNETEDSA